VPENITYETSLSSKCSTQNKNFTVSLHFILINIRATNGYFVWSTTVPSYTVLMDIKAKSM